MAKLYEVVVEGTKYRILSGNVAQAIKVAVAAQLDGKDEPTDLSVSVRASIVPAIERVKEAAKPGA